VIPRDGAGPFLPGVSEVSSDTQRVVDEARLAAGPYGLSVESGTPIPDARLEVLPTAERTVEEEAARPR